MSLPCVGQSSEACLTSPESAPDLCHQISPVQAALIREAVLAVLAWTPSRSTLQDAVLCRRCPSSHVRLTSV